MLGTRAAGSVATGRPVRCHATSYFCTRFISCESPLALTKLAILEGDPGMGKPLLALDLCARVTRGGLFPDGSDVTAPGKRPVGGRFFAFARFEKRVGDSKAARRARRPAQIDCIAYLCQRCRATTTSPHRQQLANQLASPPRCATIAACQTRGRRVRCFDCSAGPNHVIPWFHPLCWLRRGRGTAARAASPDRHRGRRSAPSEVAGVLPFLCQSQP